MFVYILHSKVLNQFYAGHTADLEKRMKRHNRGGVPSTKRGLPWKLVTSFEVSSRSDAMKLERKIKKRGIERFLNEQKT